MNIASYFFHTVAYYASWLLCLYLAAHEHGTLGAVIVITMTAIQVAWQYYYRLPTQGLLWFALCLTILGSSIDTVLLWSGMITFASNPFSLYFTAPWMSALWASFAVTTFATLRSLFKARMLFACLAFFGFMAAYALGVKIGAAHFPHGYLTCVLVGAIWSILLPFYLSQYESRFKG